MHRRSLIPECLPTLGTALAGFTGSNEGEDTEIVGKGLILTTAANETGLLDEGTADFGNRYGADREKLSFHSAISEDGNFQQCVPEGWTSGAN